MSEVKGPGAGLPAEAPGEGPPASSSFGGSRRPSLGWWPPPSHLCRRLHVAFPLRPCLPSSVLPKHTLYEALKPNHYQGFFKTRFPTIFFSQAAMLNIFTNVLQSLLVP